MCLSQASGAPSTSPGGASDVTHPGKHLGCDQAPRWREMWVVSPSPALVWTREEAGFGHLRSSLPCPDPTFYVAQASLGCLCSESFQLVARGSREHQRAKSQARPGEAPHHCEDGHEGGAPGLGYTL